MITSQNSVLLHFHKQLFNCVLYNCLFFALFARALQMTGSMTTSTMQLMQCKAVSSMQIWVPRSENHRNPQLPFKIIKH